MIETEFGFRCSFADCAQNERVYRKLAGLASHQSFVHKLRSDRPYRQTSTRRGLDRKAGQLDEGRLRVLAAIPKMHAPPMERIIPDIFDSLKSPVDRGNMQFISRRVEWMILDLARELRQPADHIRTAFSIIASPKPKPLAPRSSRGAVPRANERSESNDLRDERHV